MIARGILIKKNSEIIQLVTMKHPEYIHAYLQTLLVGTHHKVGARQSQKRGHNMPQQNH